MISQDVDRLTAAALMGVENFNQVAAGIRSRRQEMIQTLADPVWQNDFKDYAEFRMEDLKAMITGLDGCAKLVEAMHQRQDFEFFAQFQSELTEETHTVSFNMMNELAALGAASPEAGKVVDELQTLLLESLDPSQGKAEKALAEKNDKKAAVAMNAAAQAIAQAIDLLDKAVVEFVHAKNKAFAESERPESGPAQPLPDPTEEEILAALAEVLKSLEAENRANAGNKLGIAGQSNLEVETDWEKTGEKKPKSEMEKLRRKQQQQMQQAKKSAAAAARAQQMANQNAKNAANQIVMAAKGSWKERDISGFAGRNDWNNIRSQLRESLTQDVESAVPEKYREAINDYFKNIAETLEP